MNKKLNKAVYYILIISFLFVYCKDQPTKPEYDNPLDELNPSTGGDPFDLKLSIGGGGILLVWNPIDVPQFDRYVLSRKVDSSEYEIWTEFIDKLHSTFTDTAISNGHLYTYFISALDESGAAINSKATEMSINSAPFISIDDSSGFSAVRAVNVSVLAFGAVKMQVGNPDLGETPWVDYQTSFPVTLPIGDTHKIVNVKFVLAGGDTSEAVSDTTYPVPMNPAVIIDNDSTYTSTRDVNLNLTADGALWIRIFNDSLAFSELSESISPSNGKLKQDSGFDPPKLTDEDDWIPYSDTLSWQLSAGEGVKKVYVEFKNDFEIVEAVFDSIMPLPMNAELEIAHNSEYTPSREVLIFPSAEGSNIECRFSEDNLFQGITWIGLTDSVMFTLSTGGGVKTVYAEFRNDFEIVEAVFDTIMPLPMNAELLIAHDSEYTPSRNVWIFPSAEGSNIECRFSEDSLFQGITWIGLTDSVMFTLSTGGGVKTVFAEFRNDFAMTESVFDNITPLPMNEQFNINHDDNSTPISQVWLFPQVAGSNIEFKFSEDISFSGVEWNDLADSISFPLSPGLTTKTVYGIFKNDFEVESDIISDEIEPQGITNIVVIDSNNQFVNSSSVTLSFPGEGAAEMKVNSENDSSSVSWQAFSSVLEDFDLGTGDGIKYAYSWFRNDFYVVESIDSIYLDTYCIITDFIWTSNGNDTLTAGDVIHFELTMEDDNIGTETGGTALLSLPGAFTDLQLTDMNDGTYTLDYTIEANCYVIDGNITANFIDRAGNAATPVVSPDPITIVTYWEVVFNSTGEDFGNCVQQTSDGGYIITGKTVSGGEDVWIIKTDALGEMEWEQTFDNGSDDCGNYIQETVDGGFIIAGYTNTGASPDILLLKIDAVGNEVWHRTFGGSLNDIGYSLKQTYDHGYIITGYQSQGGTNQDIWLIKTDENGNEEWNTYIGGSNSEIGYDIQITSDGGYVICGKYSTGTFGYAKLAKINAEGDSVLWNYNFFGSVTTNGYSVRETMDGGYILTGNAWLNYPAGSSDIFLLKTNSDGNEVWSETYGSTGFDTGQCVVETTDGEFMIAGTSAEDLYVLKTDAVGIETWSNTYGGPNVDEGKYIQQTSDGGFIIVGSTSSFGSGDSDIYLLKLPPQ